MGKSDGPIGKLVIGNVKGPEGLADSSAMGLLGGANGRSGFCEVDGISAKGVASIGATDGSRGMACVARNKNADARIEEMQENRTIAMDALVGKRGKRVDVCYGKRADEIDFIPVQF